MSVYRDQCKQSELSDLFAGGSTQVEPGSGGCFPVIGAISFTQLHRRTCSLCKQHYEKLFGRKVVPTFCPPARYTGKSNLLLINLQFLCNLSQYFIFRPIKSTVSVF